MRERQRRVYPPYDDAILHAGWIKTEMSCARGEQEPSTGYTQPSIKRKDLLGAIESTKQWTKKYRVGKCEAAGGCPEDCQFRRYLETPPEVIANIILGNNGLPKPSRFKRFLDRIGL